jgi:hypothetical protein
MADVNDATLIQGGLTDAEKHANVVGHAFAGDEARLEAFCRAVREAIPPGTSVVLRGSAVVGADVIGLVSLTGFFVPGVHSRPLSDDDPDIAPSLVPLRAELMAMVGRPVNIQASRDIVLAFRGDLLDQPYLTLIEKPDTLTLLDRADVS